MLKAMREAFGGLRVLGGIASEMKSAGAPPESGGNLITAWFAGLGGLQNSELTEPMRQHALIYRGVDVISRSTTRIPVMVRPVGSDGAGDEIQDHWMIRLLRSPGQGRTGSQLIRAMQVSLKLRGECHLWERDLGRGAEGRNGIRRPQSIWLLHPHAMKPDVQGGELRGWFWNNPASKRREFVPVDELTSILYENPYDPFRGLGPIQAAMGEFENDHRAVLWNSGLLKNKAVPPIVFRPSGTWPEGERERFLESWHNKLEGASRQGMSAALPKGIELQELRYTQQEMQWIEGRRFSGQRGLAALGVPPFYTNDMDDADYANAGAQKEVFWENTMGPDAEMLGGALTSMLQKYEPDRELVFDMSAVLAEVLPEQYARKVETADRLWRMGFPADTVNQRLGLNLDTAGQPHLQEGFLDSRVMPAAAMLEEPEEEPEEPDDPEVTDEDDPEERGADPGNLLDKILDSRVDKNAERDRTVLYSGMAREWGSHASRFNRAFRNWAFELRREVERNLVSATRKGAKEALPEGELPGELVPEDVLFELEPAQRKLTGIFVPAMVAAIEAAAGSADIGVDFEQLDPEVRAIMAAKTIRIREQATTLREAVRSSILESIEEGRSVRSAGAELRKVFASTRTRSLTIARTEMAQAFSTGRFFGIKATAGRLDRIEWVSSRDGRVRETHASLDGKSVPVGERFANGLRYPSDPTGPGDAGERINCRCQPRRIRR